MISSPGAEHGLAMRACRREGGGTSHQRNVAAARVAGDLDDGVERRQCHAEIRRVGGDAMLAPAEHRMKPVVAAAARRSRRPGVRLLQALAGS